MPAVLLTRPQQPKKSRNLQPGLLPNRWHGGRGQVITKVRYRSLAKNATRSFVVLGLANIYLARTRLMV
jgi:hypothetical protein